MSFRAQNRFEELLIKASQDPSCRPEFYQQLIKSDLFIIEEEPGLEGEGKIRLEKDYKLRIRKIEFDGQFYTPVFSSLLRLQEFVQQEVNYISMNAIDFIKIHSGDDLLLNPGAEYAKIFSSDELKSIIDGTIGAPGERHSAVAGEQILIGHPANYPHELAEALIKLYKKNKRVKRAWLANFQQPAQNEEAHTLLGIEAEGDWDQIIADTGLVINGVSIPEPPVDIIQVTNDDGLGDYFLNYSKPFYRKGLFGIF